MRASGHRRGYFDSERGWGKASRCTDPVSSMPLLAWTCNEMHSTNGGVSCLDVIKAVAALFSRTRSFSVYLLCTTLYARTQVMSLKHRLILLTHLLPCFATISDDSGPAAMHTGGASHTSPPILFAGVTAALVTAALVGSRCPC